MIAADIISKLQPRFAGVFYAKIKKEITVT